MIKKFAIVKASRASAPVREGDIVFKCVKFDYGCASDDTRSTGTPYVSVTADPQGDYPFFTIPLEDLKALL